MSESHDSHGLQISLKWLLISVSFAGAGLGLLGRLFYRDPNEFRLALMLVTVVAPFLLAVGTIIRLGWRAQRRTLMAWGILLLAAPFIGFGVMTFANHLYGAHGYGIVDNATLIQQRLPNELTTPWVWQELERRVQAGSLSQGEVDEAIETLTRHIQQNSAQGLGRPLHWEGDFIRLAAQNKLISQRTLFDFCDAFYGKPRFDGFSAMPVHFGRIGIEFGNPWDVHSRLPIKLIWFPRRILVDGMPVRFKTDISHHDRWRGSIVEGVSSGDHELSVEVECAYVANMSGSIVDTGCVERSKWPQQLHQTWTTSVIDNKTLMGSVGPGVTFMRSLNGNMAVSEIVPTTRSTSDPTASKAVNVERVMIKAGPRSITAALEIVVSDHLRIPLSCDVILKLGGKTYEVGRYYCARWPSRENSSDGEFEVDIETLAADVRNADVTLSPNPGHIRHVPGVTEIWGKPIIFRNVPVERLDLEDERP